MSPFILTLIRICTISLILTIASAINFIPLLQAIAIHKHQARIWSILTSSIWLFISCLVMITITCCGFKIKTLSTHNRKIAVYLFVVWVCSHIPSLILGVLSETNNKYMYWQFEVLYSVLPLYFVCLIYFFNDKRYTQIINLLLFSFMLFITPFIRLLLIIKSFPLKPLPLQLILSCSFICCATSLFISIHIVFLLKHYNSGLFLKLIIISCLMYSIITMIIEKIDFDKHYSIYTIYNYYIIFAALIVMYSCEIFIDGAKKVRKLDVKSIIKSPSIDIQKELMETTINDLETRERGESLLHSLVLTMSPTQKIARTYETNDKIDRKSTELNPNQTIDSFHVDSVIKIFPDFKPCRKNRNKYFNEIKIKRNSKRIDRISDSITAIVPFYNEKASEIHATLRSLYLSFDYIKKKEARYKFTHFNVLLVGDGWFKADISTKRYLVKLYNCCTQMDDSFESFAQQKHKHNTIVLQTKFNKKLCINPFRNNEKRMFLKVTTIIKIDNRKKANSHEWFLGRYGFAEWCKCEYMFFTDAYSTMNEEGLYAMLMHMKEAENQDVVCCTGRARVYTIKQELFLKNLLRELQPDADEESDTDEKKEESEEKHDNENDTVCDSVQMVPLDLKVRIAGIGTNTVLVEDDNKYDDDVSFYEWWGNDIFASSDGDADELLYDDSVAENVFSKIQDIEFDHRLTVNAHLRACQMFEFEALYGTIGCYLLGGFLPVIPGPCGFYRSKYLLINEVRGWYFEKINQQNDPNNVDLVLGNMKLAEDRILTISSILNTEYPVRHSLVADCIFYFDPIPDLTQLMKQRRRWLNGSIATVLFVLRKISFSEWKVNVFRRYYVLSCWYMQLLMYIVVALSPPLIFTISFKYGLAQILDLILIDDGAKERKMTITIGIFMSISWIMYLTFIYFVNGQTRIKFIKKETIVQLTLIISYMFGLLTLFGTLLQMVAVFRPNYSSSNNNIVSSLFNYAVILIQITFFMQSFILAPLVSKDFKTVTILLKTCFHYFIYAPFYVTFFFINAIANVHDLSWGTRPDKDSEAKNNNPKATTIKILLGVIFIDILIGVSVQPFSQKVYPHIIFFSILAFPSIYQIFFSLLWLIKTRFNDLWSLCKPKKMSDQIQYVGLSGYRYRAPQSDSQHDYVQLTD